jgi:flagellin
MSLVVNTNIASMNAQRSLSTSGRELQTAMERLSTGKKINSAADDAAGFSIAESMTAQIRGLSMASKNASDGISLLKVVENATNDVTDMLQRVRELAVQAKSGTNSATDIKNLQGEADALMNEITRVSTDTTYNGKARLGADAGTVNIQVGYEDGDQIALKSYSVSNASLSLESAAFLTANKSAAGLAARADAANIATATALGATAEAATAGTGAAAKEASLAGFATAASTAMTSNKMDISSVAALTTISAAIDTLSGYKAEWGAGQNRLEYTVSNLMNVVEFTSAARSRIEDADFAVEAARLAKNQVLQQTGAAMLAQANASPQLALSLLA